MLSSPAFGAVNGDGACGQAARDAEQTFALPDGVLAAIGQVESAGWPWTANVDGVGEVYASKDDAVAALNRARDPKPGNIDVGCFQISMRYHPLAFSSMAEALDPVANATYAARFLRDLHDRLGGWDRAIGAYHSLTEPLEADYRGRVMAAWKHEPARTVIAEAIDDQPRWRVIPIGDPIQTGVTVWTVTKARQAGLPMVVTR